MKKRLLAVGDSTDIEIIFSSGGRRGRFSKSPRLYTSDPTILESRLRLRGEIIYESDTTLDLPARIEPFGLEVNIGEVEDEYKIKVNNISNEKYELKLVSNNPAILDIDMPGGEIKPGKDKEIKVKLIDPDQHGTVGFQNSFTIELTDSTKTRFTIPVSYRNQQAAAQAHAQRTSPQTSQSGIKPTGLKTKSGASIDMIEAGNTKVKSQ